MDGLLNVEAVPERVIDEGLKSVVEPDEPNTDLVAKLTAP